METQIEESQNEFARSTGQLESSNSIKGGTLTAQENLKSSARQAGQQLKSQAEQLVQDQKEGVAGQIAGYSDALKGAAHQLKNQHREQVAALTEGLATRLDQTSRYLRENNFSGLMNDASALAKKQPELFYGGMFFAGFLITRFLKASQPAMAESKPSSPGRSDRESELSQAEITQPS